MKEKTSSMMMKAVLGFWGVWLVALAGCAMATESAADVTGKYQLMKVNGAKVPAEISHGQVKLKVKSGEFEIKVDGTCRSKVVFGPPSGKPVTRIVKARYTQKGKKLKMKWEKAGRTEGTVEGDVFTMNNEGIVFLYRRVVEKKE